MAGTRFREAIPFDVASLLPRPLVTLKKRRLSEAPPKAIHRTNPRPWQHSYIRVPGGRPQTTINPWTKRSAGRLHWMNKTGWFWSHREAMLAIAADEALTTNTKNGGPPYLPSLLPHAGPIDWLSS